MPIDIKRKDGISETFSIPGDPEAPLDAQPDVTRVINDLLKNQTPNGATWDFGMVPIRCDGEWDKDTIGGIVPGVRIVDKQDVRFKYANFQAAVEAGLVNYVTNANGKKVPVKSSNLNYAESKRVHTTVDAGGGLEFIECNIQGVAPLDSSADNTVVYDGKRAFETGLVFRGTQGALVKDLTGGGFHGDIITVAADKDDVNTVNPTQCVDIQVDGQYCVGAGRQGIALTSSHNFYGKNIDQKGIGRSGVDEEPLKYGRVTETYFYNIRSHHGNLMFACKGDGFSSGLYVDRFENDGMGPIIWWVPDSAAPTRANLVMRRGVHNTNWSSDTAAHILVTGTDNVTLEDIWAYGRVLSQRAGQRPSNTVVVKDCTGLIRIVGVTGVNGDGSLVDPAYLATANPAKTITRADGSTETIPVTIQSAFNSFPRDDNRSQVPPSVIVAPLSLV